MKKLFLFTALFLWAFSVFAYGNEEHRFIDAEETEGKLIPIDEMEDRYITADSSGDCVYIVNKYMQKLSDSAFKCVYNLREDYYYIIVRYADTDDLTGFAVLDKDMNEVIPPNNYFRIYTDSVNSKNCFVCDRCDENGNLTADYYLLDDHYNLKGLDESLCVEIFSRSADDCAEDRVEAAVQAGLVPEPLKCEWVKSSADKYDFASLAVNAVMLKKNTNIYDYIKDNNITLDYDKYLDVASPYVLLAEKMDILPPSEDDKYFYTEKSVTRQEAAYILNSLCNIFGIKTTPKETLFADDGEIADWAREAVYNVSGTPVDDTYILAQIGLDRFMPDNTHYSYDFETAIMAVWRLYGFDTIDFESFPSKYNETYIGSGLYVYQGTEGRWGVYGDDVNIEPFYELPCGSTTNYVAFDDVFTLILENSYLVCQDNSVTYYIFKRGELIKTFIYSSDDVKEDKPCGYAFDSPLAMSVSGSNVVYMDFVHETSEYVYFIKRLVSEKIAGEGYSKMTPYGDGEFSAVETSTGKRCILNPDGSFKEYVN
ncbi:MAG: hypothetical protein LUC92_10705 [Clostridiales bacterium]|nr:hypothetical protein [Clostridiales bacterium]